MVNRRISESNSTAIAVCVMASLATNWRSGLDNQQIGCVPADRCRLVVIILGRQHENGVGPGGIYEGISNIGAACLDAECHKVTVLAPTDSHRKGP